MTSSKPLAEKVDDLIVWDKAYTRTKLQQEGKPNDSFYVNKAMNLPGYFQRKYTNMVKDDLVISDSALNAFIIPSFAPLDLELFVKTRIAPVYVMGLIDFPFLSNIRFMNLQFMI